MARLANGDLPRPSGCLAAEEEGCGFPVADGRSEGLDFCVGDDPALGAAGLEHPAATRADAESATNRYFRTTDRRITIRLVSAVTTP